MSYKRIAAHPRAPLSRPCLHKRAMPTDTAPRQACMYMWPWHDCLSRRRCAAVVGSEIRGAPCHASCRMLLATTQHQRAHTLCAPSGSDPACPQALRRTCSFLLGAWPVGRDE